MSDKAYIRLIGGELHVQDVLVEFLTGLGYKVCCVTDIVAALDVAQSQDFSVALIDFNPFAKDGFEAVTRLRRAQPAIGAVMMTGNPTLELVIEAMRHEMTDVVVKPFRLEDLCGALERAVAQYHRDREMASLRKRIVELEECLNHIERQAGKKDTCGTGTSEKLKLGAHSQILALLRPITVSERGALEGNLEVRVKPAHKDDIALHVCCAGQRGF